MANVDRANGFRPVKSLIGAPWTSLVRTYPAVEGRSATNNSGDIYIGDIVELATGNAVPHVTVSVADTNLHLGVVVAVGTKNSDTALNTDNNHRYFDPDNLSKRYLAWDEDGYVGVVPMEACLFSVQAAASQLVGAVQGDGAQITITGTTTRGSRTTGNSIQTVSTGAEFTIVEHDTSPNNDTADAGGLARYIVKSNFHANPIA